MTSQHFTIGKRTYLFDIYNYTDRTDTINFPCIALTADSTENFMQPFAVRAIYKVSCAQNLPHEGDFIFIWRRHLPACADADIYLEAMRMRLLRELAITGLPLIQQV